MHNDDSIPFILNHAVEEIENHVRSERDASVLVLETLRGRLRAEMDALDEMDPGNVRPRKSICRQLDQVRSAFDNLSEEKIKARLELETRAHITRYKDLERRERSKQLAAESAMQHSEKRFLPMAPMASGAGTKRPRNYGALIAQELKYKFGMDARPVNLIMFDMCKNCMVAMQYNVALQQLVCPVPSCGYWKRFADMTSAALAYGEEIEFCKYSYNPVTHLDDTIKYAEAGEAYVVPPAHLEKVMSILYANGVKPENITIKMIRDIVYDTPGIKTENTVQIYSRLTGRSPWRLSTFAKDQIRIMFVTEEPYYRKHCGGRTNNLSYPYKLYKYCELLGYWEMLESLPLLRGVSNLSLHDAIQAKINRDLDWEFIPTTRQEENIRVTQTLRKSGIST